MTEAPPPPFTAYPRSQIANGYGSVERFEALGEAYFGLNWVFAANAGLVIAAEGIAQIQPAALYALIAATFFLITSLSYSYNQKVAQGMGWHKSVAVLISLLMGVNSALFCGLAGFVAMQVILLAEMRRYGFKATFGFRRVDFRKEADKLHRRGITTMELAPRPKW